MHAAVAAPAQVHRLAKELDLDGDGEVEFREFAQRVLERLEIAKDDQAPCCIPISILP